MSESRPGLEPSPDPSGMQAEIAGFDRGILVVEGSPGTGKSTAIDERVQRITADGRDPSGVAVVTSTALSAQSHLAELERRIPGPYEELVVGTWEDFAERILRAWPVEAGLDPDFSVVGRAERLAMLLVRFDELPLRHHEIRGDPTGLMKRLIAAIDHEKQLGPVESDAAANRSDPGVSSDRVDVSGRPFAADPLLRREFEELVGFHDRMLADLGCLDRTDLCRIAGDLLANHASVAGDLATRHPQLVIDELEDLNPVRAGLLEPLARRARGVVGMLDPLAGGAPGFTDELIRSSLPNADRLRLDQVWSVNGGQIEAARAVAGPSRAGAEQGKARWSDGADCEVRFWRSESTQAEVQAVAREVEHQLGEGVPADQIAVVVRDANRDGQLLSAALEERGVPAATVGGAALFRMPEVRDTVAWLRALVDPDDGGAVTRALTRPPIELRPVDLARLTVIARRRKLDMVAACEAALDSPTISPESRERLDAFLTLHRAASGALDRHRADVFVRRLIERIGFRRQGMFAARPEAAERLLGLSRLAEAASEWCRREPRGSTRDFVAFVSALSETGLDVENGPFGPAAGKVRITGMDGVKGRRWRRVYMLGLERAGDGERPLVAGAITSASDAVVLSRVGGEGGPPAPLFEDAFNAVCTIEEVHEEEMFGPAEDLHSTYRMMRDEVIEASWRAGRELIEPRLDTPTDLNRAIVRYLELLKLSALAQRPGGGLDPDAIGAINGLLGQVATPEQMAELERSTLDPYLLANERERDMRQQLIDARSEPSLAAFVPRRGEDLRLSASDLDLYLTCPLKYKFARVFGIPKAPTINQRFGILIHNVLQRYHDPKTAPADAGLAGLMGLLEAGWRRSGFGDSHDELQFRDRAVSAMENYWQAESRSQSTPVWLERQFEFRIGPHYLRGRVDRVDRHQDGTYEVIDYKTGMRVDTVRHGGDIQLALYRLGAREAWDTEIEAGSYYYVLEGEKVAVESGPDDRERVERTALEVGEGILGQDFEPRPSPGVCGWCDFRLVCPASEA